MLHHLRNPVLALETQYGEIELLVDLLGVDAVEELLPRLLLCRGTQPGLGALELEVGLPVQVVELGAFGLLDRPVRVTKRLGQAVPKRPVLYELRMSLEAARLSFGKSDRRTRVHEAAHVAGRLDQGVGRGSTQKCGLNVTANALVQVGLKDAGISVIHDLLEYGLTSSLWK